MMHRFVHFAVSYITAVGYFLAVTWGPAWHDHHQGCCPSHECSLEHTTWLEQTPVPAHSHCCSHHHPSSCAESHTEEAKSSGQSPSPSPCQDDDCVVCQTLAHPPLPAPTIAVVDVSIPVSEWAMPARPEAVVSLPDAYDSRGPPLSV